MFDSSGGMGESGDKKPIKKERHLPGDFVIKPIGKLIGRCYRHSRTVLAIVVILSIFFSLGIPRIQLSVDPTDFLPTDDPNTQALKRMFEKTSGMESIEIVITKLDYNKSAEYGVYNVTDAVAIRAADELWRYIKARVPEVNNMNGVLAHAYSYLNLANHANNPEYYKLPESDAELEFLGIFVYSMIGQIMAQMGPYFMTPEGYMDWFILPVGYLPAEKEPGEVISLKNVYVGQKVHRAIQDYIRDCEAGKIEYDIWDHEYLSPSIGVGTAIYRLTDVIVQYAIPLAIATIIFILVCLFVAFRNPATVFIGLINLLMTFLWTLGFMGWAGIRISPFNIAFLPLVLGVGIDYSLHMINAWQEYRSRGYGDEEAFEKAGGRAVPGELLATVDSVIGLLAISLCGMVAMETMGIVSAFAMTVVTLLSWMLIPAMTSLSKTAKRASAEYKPSKFLRRVARGVRGHRGVTIAAIVIVSLVLFVNIGNVRYMTDLFKDVYPEGDPYMRDYNFIINKIAPQMGAENSSVTAEILILEGDLTDPQTVEYIYDLEDELRKNPRSVSSLTVGVLGYHWYIGLYEAEKYGNVGTVLSLMDSVAKGYPIEGSCPTTREGIERAIQDIRADPFWSPWLNIFLSYDDTISFLPVMYVAGYDWDELVSIEEEIYEAIEAVEDRRPSDVSVHVEGLRTSTYSFMTTTITWSTILTLIGVALSVVMELIFIRRWRAILIFFLVIVLSLLCFLGLLPIFGIMINPGIIIPLIFVTVFAPDYADHMLWNSYKTGDVEYAMETSGKAILFSAITTAGAFYIFNFMYIKAYVAQPMLAITLSVIVTFLLVILLIPALLTDKELEAIE